MSVGALGANLLLRLIQLYGIIGLPLIRRLVLSQRELHFEVLQKGKVYRGPNYSEVKKESYKDTFGFVASLAHKVTLAVIHEYFHPEVGK